jgi:hypothetical protein
VPNKAITDCRRNAAAGVGGAADRRSLQLAGIVSAAPPIVAVMAQASCATVHLWPVSGQTP